MNLSNIKDSTDYSKEQNHIPLYDTETHNTGKDACQPAPL